MATFNGRNYTLADFAPYKYVGIWDQFWGDVLAELVARVTAAATSAGIATTKAGEASDSAGVATTQAGTATTQAGIATTQAGIATTKAGEAATNAQAVADALASIADGPLTSWAGRTGAVVPQAGDYTAAMVGAATTAAVTAAVAASYPGDTADAEEATAYLLAHS